MLQGGALTCDIRFGDTWQLGQPCTNPPITAQPPAQTVGVDESASLSVATLSGSVYQWRKNGVNLSNSTRISGATNATLNIANVNWSDVGTYDCVVSNACGSVTSSAATLNILTCNQAWANQGPAPFSQRWVHAQAYSGVNGGTLLFGGRDVANNTLSDTWLGTPNGWSRVATSGPSLRTDHAMCQLGNGRVLLFGGKSAASGAASVLGDTWEWNGTQWSLLSVTGPAPRLGHQMVYDATRNRVVLFRWNQRR